MARSARTLLALALLVVGCDAAYKRIANCVPGPMMDIVGRPALYTKVLEVLMPGLYGDLKLLSKGEEGDCMDAANAINSNSILMENVNSVYHMEELGVLKSMEVYDNTTSYLYVFDNAQFQDFHYIGNCVPGGVVGTLNQTGGRIALYTVALQTILPSLLGDLKFLGSGNTEDCLAAQNAINTGNETMLELLKDKTSDLDINQVGIIKGLDIADNMSNYLFVFENAMWNHTWNVMDGRRLFQESSQVV
mmetsp:Transcript_91719/g.163243  ORF Transcript_91719/g.163243 Transcript_91719/m.163243 type:complete len:248 (-) Transcript_91719:40-783(-)|eukprot:CAMPEP_0197661242 /NCGR_PEP_ID=MMETSP1338-20131121/51338_1 /TAXON_ID=43686 ORGANISM="Pelagodinium beii, Strain RCC1491" /NCGR_SAMPLE_ID=MMETSP1338 /ASSEMBLY_ACC=CAM_ASM_000754 /LENGTH=247 /DNA_ID=CAMNT_0043238761 /DNA_START=60 /DNA_END=803 /DNA_ORIENTATION=+